MVRNFIDFGLFPWATQCLEMSKTTGRLWPGFIDRYFVECIKDEDFDSALQDARSVGSWAHSVQGHDYWEEIYNNEIF